MNRTSSPFSATIVTETYNLAAGQSFARLEAALRTAAAAAGPRTGPHSVLLIDASDDERNDELVRRVADASGAHVRHARVPIGTAYDVVKDIASELVTTDAVVYLDGDCEPVAGGDRWLDAMLGALDSTGAPGVAGTTLYEGDSPLRLACSVLDFGFLLDRPGGALGCYASNNVAFLAPSRAAVPAERDGLRCSCYLHAQTFARQGTPLRHVDSALGVVRHEFPAFFDERLRRGYDAVAVMWVDPRAIESQYFAGSRLRACTAGTARFLRHSLARDRHRLRRFRQYSSIGPVGAFAALVLIPLLRAVEVVGVWRALLLPRDQRWKATVTREAALESALTSLAGQ